MSAVALERFLVLRTFGSFDDFGRVLLVGDGHVAEKLASELRGSHAETINVTGLLASEVSEASDPERFGLPVRGSSEDLPDLIANRDVDTIVVCTNVDSKLVPISTLLSAKLKGIEVLDATEFYEHLERKVLLEKLEPIQMLYRSQLRMTTWRWLLKGIRSRSLRQSCSSFSRGR